MDRVFILIMFGRDRCTVCKIMDLRGPLRAVKPESMGDPVELPPPRAPNRAPPVVETVMEENDDTEPPEMPAPPTDPPPDPWMILPVI